MAVILFAVLAHGISLASARPNSSDTLAFPPVASKTAKLEENNLFDHI